MLLASLQGTGWCPWCGNHMTGWGWFMIDEESYHRMLAELRDDGRGLPRE